MNSRTNGKMRLEGKDYIVKDNSIKIIWKDYQVLLLDPDTADTLIKEAYAFNGALLIHFAYALHIPKIY